MPGPGEWVSDGKYWRPAKIKVRLGYTDKNDVTPPKYLLDPETGKPVEQYDPAAVEQIKKELGKLESDGVKVEDMKLEVAHYDSENEKVTLNQTVEKLAGVIEKLASNKETPPATAKQT